MTVLHPDATTEPVPSARTVTGDEALPVMVGITVALLPILVPAGPGNTAVADAAMAGSHRWSRRCGCRASGCRSRSPTPPGSFLLVIGGALAATVAGAPLSTALVLAQDVFLLLWAATLALGRYDPAIIAAATVTWCRVAVVYSAVVLVAYLIGFGSAERGHRQGRGAGVVHLRRPQPGRQLPGDVAVHDGGLPAAARPPRAGGSATCWCWWRWASPAPTARC